LPIGGARVSVVVIAALTSALAPVTTNSNPAVSGVEIRVPEDVPRLQLAIAQAQPGDTIVRGFKTLFRLDPRAEASEPGLPICRRVEFSAPTRVKGVKTPV
jgi:hypothetical protein